MDTSSTDDYRDLTDLEADQITRLEELAYEIKVQEVMTPDPVTVTPETSMNAVLELFRSRRITGAPVVDEGRFVGIISIEDLIRSLIKGDLEAPCSRFMTSTNLITVRPGEPLVEALKVFVNSRVGRLPVTEDGQTVVGILTKGDITRGLLSALKRDIQAEEMRRYRARHLFEDIKSDRTSLILRYNIQPRDFIHGGEASSHIKRALVRLGANPQVARRTGIAVYEAEMNLVIHTTDGGVIRVEIEPHQISMDVYDYGPGIKDIQQAMQPGFSTASEEIRALGFGAGMGLINISRCVDEMNLELTWGKGTRLRMKIFLNDEEAVGEGYQLKETGT